jgi:hypothetical protein
MARAKLNGATCRYCGSDDIAIEWRLKAKRPGTYSIAGCAPKVVATRWPWAICNGCGHESEGKQ